MDSIQIARSSYIPKIIKKKNPDMPIPDIKASSSEFMFNDHANRRQKAVVRRMPKKRNAVKANEGSGVGIEASNTSIEICMMYFELYLTRR
ncbi:14108_t:CDS:2, partial [Acaulospora colombiana]